MSFAKLVESHPDCTLVSYKIRIPSATALLYFVFGVSLMSLQRAFTYFEFVFDVSMTCL